MVMHAIAYCPSCGRERAADAAFCTGCGRRLADLDVAEPTSVGRDPATATAEPVRDRPPWWAWPFSRRTARRLYVVAAVLLAVAALRAPGELEMPCTLAQARILGVLTTRVEATCVYRWPSGLLGPSTIERRDPRVSVGLGAP